ncbi:MAG: hypothetical protein ACLSD6_09670 [Clostridium sp.]
MERTKRISIREYMGTCGDHVRTTAGTEVQTHVLWTTICGWTRCFPRL